MKSNLVVYFEKPDQTKGYCGPRCHDSKSNVCFCSCNGENHRQIESVILDNYDLFYVDADKPFPIAVKHLDVQVTFFKTY